MSDKNHSPLRWHEDCGVLLDANGFGIYTCSDDDERMIANRRLIIRAVNSHDQLLAAAKMAVSAFPPSQLRFDAMKNAHVALLAAIAEAEKE